MAIGPYELETEWIDYKGGFAHLDRSYDDMDGYYSYVAVYHYRKASTLEPNKLVPVLVFERSDPSFETVDFLRDAVNALNRAAAIRRVS